MDEGESSDSWRGSKAKPPVYEDRLVFYADILGWTAAIESHDPEALLEVIQEIHQPAAFHSERARAELAAQRVVHTDVGTFPVAAVNPLYMGVQFGAFSDNFVYSMPSDFGGRILTVASKLIGSLLRRGLLIRGGIALGQLHHLDNVVFGPALNEAVKIEQQEAVYPRILVSSKAAEHIERLSLDPRAALLIRDHTGRSVVNPFSLGLDGPEEMLSNLIRENFYPDQVDRVVARERAALIRAGRLKEAEKWEYMARLIEGPVLDSNPKLRKAWKKISAGPHSSNS